MSEAPNRIWFCRELHLAYPDGDTSSGARVGLQRFCTEEDHPTWIGCGWLQVVPLPLDRDAMIVAMSAAWINEGGDTIAEHATAMLDAALRVLGVTE